MEFNIKKKATLPFIEVDLIKDGRTDYNYTKTSLVSSTIYFYMKNIETDKYKVLKGISVFDEVNYKIYYQFTKKNTSEEGRYIGEFRIYNDQGLVELPLREKLFINILPSFVDPDFCKKFFP
jgi:hypothetical protein